MSSCKWPIVKLRTIPSWFRRHFVGSMFWYRETGATHLASGGYRWLQFWTIEGVVDHVTSQFVCFFSQVFLRLLYLVSIIPRGRLYTKDLYLCSNDWAMCKLLMNKLLMKLLQNFCQSAFGVFCFSLCLNTVIENVTLYLSWLCGATPNAPNREEKSLRHVVIAVNFWMTTNRKRHSKSEFVACGNIPFSWLFAAGSLRADDN